MIIIMSLKKLFRLLNDITFITARCRQRSISGVNNAMVLNNDLTLMNRKLKSFVRNL